MAPLVTARSEHPDMDSPLSLNWKENPAAKKLLDALVSILTTEYIQVAKENPEIFSK